MNISVVIWSVSSPLASLRMNEAGETPMDIAKRLRHSQCEEQLTQAQTGNLTSTFTSRASGQLLPSGAASLARDKPRPQVPSMMMNNETYGTMMELPPRGPRCPHGAPAECSHRPPPPGNRRVSMLETKTLSIRNTPLPPHRPPPPSHRPPTTKPAPPAPRPTPQDQQTPRTQIPPRISETSSAETSSQDTIWSQPTSPQSPPTPKPRSTFSKQKPKRVKAIYNCSADNVDELTFVEGEVIVVEGEEDSEWWLYEAVKNVSCSEDRLQAD
ncbi:hypothetical protein F7725_028388 [Dissostichus mawsoni]|uniref:SH3 domain-containing protein n=1 Tax=Dissostichus mawsoni TaxID=36200 RepID=A0A7J5XFV3_DISMA|nr:hypothetical protein F7725_028388 [Dissostichus mawsoni]